MKAHKTMLQMMVLVALSAIAFLSLASVTFAAPPPAGGFEIAKQQKQIAADIELVNPAVLEVVQIEAAVELVEGPAATDPTDGVNPDEHVAQPDEFEDLPAGSEGDVGDSGDEELVPVHQEAEPSEEASQPPILIVTTEQSHEETPTYIPHRDHLAFTGGPQALYLLLGALIIATAAAILFLGRGNKQVEQQ
jgi:hypothetical protein